MPFTKELHYFYLYLRHRLAGLGIEVTRGDGEVMTSSLFDKLMDMIRSADMVIADITGNNPNVLFELGLCLAQGKRVILITQDEPEFVPVDIRYLEFIRYDMDRDKELFDRLANAFNNIFVERYNTLFEAAQKIFVRFKDDTRTNFPLTSRESFIDRLRYADAIGDIPDPGPALDAFLLPKIIDDVSNLDTIRAITRWTDEQG